jgi:hypothetical protein
MKFSEICYLLESLYTDEIEKISNEIVARYIIKNDFVDKSKTTFLIHKIKYLEKKYGRLINIPSDKIDTLKKTYNITDIFNKYSNFNVKNFPIFLHLNALTDENVKGTAGVDKDDKGKIKSLEINIILNRKHFGNILLKANKNEMIDVVKHEVAHILDILRSNGKIDSIRNIGGRYKSYIADKTEFNQKMNQLALFAKRNMKFRNMDDLLNKLYGKPSRHSGNILKKLKIEINNDQEYSEFIRLLKKEIIKRIVREKELFSYYKDLIKS